MPVLGRGRGSGLLFDVLKFRAENSDVVVSLEENINNFLDLKQYLLEKIVGDV
jgi:hypothetical protein